MTGGCTDDVWIVYSLHRVSFVSSPCLFTFPSLPADSLRRVLNTSASSGCNISLPSANRVRLLDDVCKMTQRLIGLEVVGDPIIEKKWNWDKGGLKRYSKRNV